MNSVCVSLEKSVSFLYSSACARRGLDIAKIQRYLSGNGYTVRKYPQEADILFFYGCAFNTEHEEASLRELAAAAEKFSTIFCVGGLAEICPEKVLRQVPAGCAVHIVSLRDCHALDAFFCRTLPFDSLSESNLSCTRPHDIWSIQVGHGCNDECSYCGDKKIVGPLRSKSLDRVLSEFETGFSKGFRQFELIGDDVAAWGLDTGDTVITLLEAVSSRPENYSVSIMELNIRYLIQHRDCLESVLRKNKIRFMMLAFQHINDRILNLMARGYTGAEVRELVAILLRNAVELHFHAILGFPSETEEEFLENIEFINTTSFSRGSYFVYQHRDYAPAARLPGRVTEERKKQLVAIARKRLAEGGYAVTEYRHPFARHASDVPTSLHLLRQRNTI